MIYPEIWIVNLIIKAPAKRVYVVRFEKLAGLPRHRQRDVDVDVGGRLLVSIHACSRGRFLLALFFPPRYHAWKLYIHRIASVPLPSVEFKFVLRFYSASLNSRNFLITTKFDNRTASAGSFLSRPTNPHTLPPRRIPRFGSRDFLLFGFLEFARGGGPRSFARKRTKNSSATLYTESFLANCTCIRFAQNIHQQF